MAGQTSTLRRGLPYGTLQRATRFILVTGSCLGLLVMFAGILAVLLIGGVWVS